MNEITSCHFKNFRVNYTEKLNTKMAFSGVEFSKLAYSQDRDSIEKNLENTNFNIIYFNDIEDTKIIIANYALDSNFTVVSFSGTKDYSLQNIKTNWNLKLKKFTSGRVHSGFLNLFYKFEKIINQYVTNNNILWTGHSRGGALAGLCQSYYGCGVNYSFGCPRFGDKEYSANNKLPHYRFTFATDPIQYLPPKILSYKHHGKKIELSEDKIFDDLDNIDEDNFKLTELTRDWNLIKYAVKDWISGKNSGRHHYKENYSECFDRFMK